LDTLWQRSFQTLSHYVVDRIFFSFSSVGAVFFYNKLSGRWYRPAFDNYSNPLEGISYDTLYGNAVAIGPFAFVVGVPIINTRSGQAIAYSYTSATAITSGVMSSYVHEEGESNMISADTYGVDASEAQEEGTELKISDDCILNYRLNQVTPTISMEVSCDEGIEGWIGIGFSPDGQMLNSVAVVGMLTPGETRPFKYALNGKSADTVEKMPEVKQTLIDASLEVDSDGRITVMKFTKMLNENDEIEIRPGETFLLYARGATSDLGHHVDRSSYKLIL